MFLVDSLETCRTGGGASSGTYGDLNEGAIIRVTLYEDVTQMGYSVYFWMSLCSCEGHMGLEDPSVMAANLEEDPVEDPEEDSMGSDDYIPHGYLPKPIDPEDFDPWDDLTSD
ncbi:hypothetical protein FNV43_RR24667 [Rhamnella rubrinervis]|uniref:Uncharacterized protein n=1 Tax=Rhamnella rubrinervis TaxID=2594499 RepID=A0A8K0DM73_9ROSA|nr:hypothetical protein FNV43_RR24667 [Rhamnella rubrinervis]